MAEADIPNPRTNPPLRLSDLPVFVPPPEAIAAHRIVGFDSKGSQARPFNLMRTTFAKRLKESGHRLIGLTSATPDAGKSFLSMNLAASLAKVAEQPVFFVDLDLRRPSLAAGIGLSVAHGVEAFLDGSIADPGKLGYRIEGSELGVFPACRVARNSAELLAGENFAALIKCFRDSSESGIVLFDLPPVFASDDAMIALEQLDAFVMVVDSGKTTKRHVKDVLAMLNPTPCIGSILNRYRGGFADIYGYGAAEYARYYEDS